MQIDIQARSFALTDTLRKHIKRRLGFSLSTSDGHILRVLVTLTDINGPRGGADKCCQIHVMLTRHPDVVIKDIEVNLYVAINRAADRAGRTVKRRLAHCRLKNRSAGSPGDEITHQYT